MSFRVHIVPVYATHPIVVAACFLAFSLLVSPVVSADTNASLSGRMIMDEVYQRHEQFPYVYEEQVMILVDRVGNRDTRKLRRYSRITSEASAQYMLLFDDPPEVRGVGLLTNRSPGSEPESKIYLPAYGPELISSIGQNKSDNFLGTDFSVNDLLPEILDNYIYTRQEDWHHEDGVYFILDVASVEEPDLRLKRHFIQQDNYYITRTDTFDRHGRIHKRQTHHDLKFLGGAMWRANMIHITDFKLKHQSLIKISRRVFSRDYVPESMFSLEWLVENQHMPAETDESENTSKTTDTPAKTDERNLTHYQQRAE